MREDYSEDGDAWNFFTHDHARSRAYRWGKDGIAGLFDDKQGLCFALALWNGRDPILRERLFGLTNSEGDHGEDVKECYFCPDGTLTHSYMKYLYRHPQAAYPYTDLVETNRRRTRTDPEYELLDTGVFDRSAPLPTGGQREQADGTARMALFSQNTMELAIELAVHDRTYEDIVVKFVEPSCSSLRA